MTAAEHASPRSSSLSFAARLKDTRIDLGLTQQAVGDACGVTRVAVAYWELGRNEPRAGQLVAMARTLKVRVDWLLLGVGQKTDEHPPYCPDAFRFVLEGVELHLKNRCKERPTPVEYADLIEAITCHLAAHPQKEWPIRLDALIKVNCP